MPCHLREFCNVIFRKPHTAEYLSKKGQPPRPIGPALEAIDHDIPDPDVKARFGLRESDLWRLKSFLTQFNPYGESRPLSETPQILLDECIPPHILFSLITRTKKPCAHVNSVGLHSMPDPSIWTYCREKGIPVLVTADHGFFHTVLAMQLAHEAQRKKKPHDINQSTSVVFVTPTARNMMESVHPKAIETIAQFSGEREKSGRTEMWRLDSRF